MASLGSSISIINTLSNVALGTWDLYETVSSGDNISTMDMAISAMTMAGGAGLARLGRFFFRGKKRINYIKGAAMAELAIRNMVKRIPSKRRRGNAKPYAVKTIAGAFDWKRGIGVAATNGTSHPNKQLERHALRFGVSYGQPAPILEPKGFTVGRCAEWRAAYKLTRLGSKVRTIRWTAAYYVKKGTNSSSSSLGGIKPPCGICRATGTCK